MHVLAVRMLFPIVNKKPMNSAAKVSEPATTVPVAMSATAVMAIVEGVRDKMIHSPSMTNTVVVRRTARNMGTLTRRSPRNPTAMFNTNSTPGRIDLHMMGCTACPRYGIQLDSLLVHLNIELGHKESLAVRQIALQNKQIVSQHMAKMPVLHTPSSRMGSR